MKYFSSTWVLLLLFLVTLFFFSYYSFKVLYLPVKEGGEPEFIFRNFFVFNFLLKAVLLLVKIFCVTMVLKLGAFLMKMELDTALLLKCVLIAEFVLFLPSLFELTYFTFIHPNYTLDEFNGFATFSLRDIVDTSDDGRFTYLLSSINVFQILYIVVLALTLGSLIPTRTVDQYLKLIAYVYLPCCLVWILVVESYNQSMI